MKNSHLILLFIISGFLVASGTYFWHEAWWDSAVYIGIGKYLFSFGEAGLIEPSRPLILPLFLGFFWKIGLDPLLFGQLLAIGFSIGTIILTYLIATHLFNEKIGLLSAFFLCFSSPFLFFSTHILTEIPSAFFLLLGIYFFLLNKPLFSGIAFSIGLLTRFFLGIPLLFILAGVFFYHLQKKNIKNIKRSQMLLFLSGLIFPFLLYLLFSQIAYGNFLLPFIVQIGLSIHTGITYTEAWHFYLTSLLLINFFILTLPFFFFRAKPNLTKQIQDTALFYFFIAIPSIGSFLAYSFFPHKEERLLLPFLPLLLILIAASAFHFFTMLCSIEKKARGKIRFSPFLFSALLLIFFGLNIFFFLEKGIGNQNPQEEFFKNYLIDKKGSIALSNPTYALLSDSKIEGLSYYPLPYPSPDLALLSLCDLLGNDEAYTSKILERVEGFRSEMKPVYSSEWNGCTYEIYEK